MSLCHNSEKKVRIDRLYKVILRKNSELRDVKLKLREKKSELRRTKVTIPFFILFLIQWQKRASILLLSSSEERKNNGLE